LIIHFLFELVDDVVEVVLSRSGGDELTASLELLADALALAISASAAAAAAACWRLRTSDCSRRSSSSFISGLLMSLGLPVPNILDAVEVLFSGEVLTGTVLGKSRSGLRPSAIDEADDKPNE
jgi:hypothetical protein